jgi:hypothetical protein
MEKFIQSGGSVGKGSGLASWEWEQIRIWGDRWLPIPSSYKVQFLVIGLNPEAIVNSLLDPTTGGWNVSLIGASLYASEANTICSLLPNLLGILTKEFGLVRLMVATL